MYNHYKTRRYLFFLKNLDSQIEHHLSDYSIDVKKWTNLVGMSKTNLALKLKQTVDMSITEYVRYIRLQHGAKLLIEEPEWSIFHVALEVGFKYHSYFTKRFKEVFGVSPAKYRGVGGELGHL